MPDSGFTRLEGRPLFYATAEGIATVRDMLQEDWTGSSLRGLIEDLLRTLEALNAKGPAASYQPVADASDGAGGAYTADCDGSAPDVSVGDSSAVSGCIACGHATRRHITGYRQGCTECACSAANPLQPGPDASASQIFDTGPGGHIVPMPDPYRMRKADEFDPQRCPCRPENGGSGVCGCTLGGPRVTC